MVKSTNLFQLWMALLATLATMAETTSFEGIVSIGCTDGICTFSGECDSLSVPGDVDGQDDSSYTNIDGEIRLTPSTCQAECSTGCVGIPGSDQTNEECIGSAGYIYCPELDDCIRPWDTNCPFDGDALEGPAEIVCASGARCNDLSDECVIEAGSAAVGGPYLSGLVGTYNLPEGCTATCEGCTCEGCANDGGESSSNRHNSLPLTIIFLATTVVVILVVPFM
jgi:hypothetical protein